MRFIDEASVYVKAGDGGRGCVSFRREAFVPRGGPDGGDGGKGGDVVIVGRKSLISLLDFTYKRNYKAENGKIGGGRNKKGRNGTELVISVPVGTEIRDEGGLLLADIVEDGQTYVAARGGRGGRGNARFVSPVHRVPTEFDEGGQGKERSLAFELKLLAGIGIIGLPNAGKSTLLRRLTSATPEVGDYPFTTLTPALGVLTEDERRLVLADIPGIIEGASRGKGLGLTFLRHIERTAMLLWVIDASSPDVVRDYTTLLTELGLYKEALVRRQRIIVLNKIDITDPLAL
ncbi:MAG: Obg family GTPase CgtA, partial [Syntrophorhabdales bacterium]